MEVATRYKLFTVLVTCALSTDFDLTTIDSSDRCDIAAVKVLVSQVINFCSAV